PVSSMPGTQHIPQRSVAPAAPVAPGYGTNGNGNGNGHVMPASPVVHRSVTPAAPDAYGRGNGANGNGHSNGNGNGNGNGHGTSFIPGLRLASQNGNGHAEASVPASSPATSHIARPTTPQPTIFVTLGDLSENWPEPLKIEINRTALAQASIPLDG